VKLDDYLAYTASFRARFVPEIEETLVASLERASDHFMITLESGEFVFARNVVMAVGVTWFAYTPDVLAQLPAEMLSHTYNHRDVRQFKGREVAIVGSGSSAIDTAHALQDAGGSVRLIARRPQLSYTSNPDPNDASLMNWLKNPSTTIGRGWGSYICAEAPLLFYRLPRHLKDRAIASHMHPAAGWFMREQVEGRLPVSLGRALAKAEAKDGRVTLTLGDKNGEETLSFDHVIAATGYRVNMRKVPFLDAGLRDAISPDGTSPAVSDNFETAVPGLYSIGLAAMDTFGPLLRFMVGAEFVAPRLGAHLDRKVSQSFRRAA
jgi:cation diffusion facilitator CzcD-associated flavoprotein CzcO